MMCVCMCVSEGVDREHPSDVSGQNPDSILLRKTRWSIHCSTDTHVECAWGRGKYNQVVMASIRYRSMLDPPCTNINRQAKPHYYRHNSSGVIY